MGIYETMSLFLGFSTLIAVGLTLWVYHRIFLRMEDQTIAMQKQVSAVVESSRAQNFLSVLNFLQQENYRKARQTVIGTMDAEFEKWTEDEKNAASLVCSSYDTLGILVKMGLAPKEIVVENWGPSILKTHHILSNFMSGYRANMGNHYWDDFPWLAGEVKIYQDSILKHPTPPQT